MSFNTFGLFVYTGGLILWSGCAVPGMWEIAWFLGFYSTALLIDRGHLLSCLASSASSRRQHQLSCQGQRGLRMSSVQCCILIVTVAVTTCGGSLSTVCSTSRVSLEPCLSFPVGKEKAPVIMEKLEGRFELSLAFLHPPLLCLWGVLGI